MKRDPAPNTHVCPEQNAPATLGFDNILAENLWILRQVCEIDPDLGIKLDLPV
jgi:hypothetical protein